MPGGEKINNRKPSLPSTNNANVNHLLWISLNFKMFITYKCTLISPPWQHLALSGLTASQTRSCVFGHAAFWAAALNFGECDCFFIGTNNQCWLGFRAELPRIRNVCCSSEIRERVAKSPTFGLWLLGEAPFVPGDSAASGNRISILWPEKAAVSVIHGDQQIETKWPRQKTSRCPADVWQTRSSDERKQKNHQGNFKCFPSICQAQTSSPFQRKTIVGTGFLAFYDWGE